MEQAQKLHLQKVRNSLLVWAGVLFALTTIGIIWVNAVGVDPTKDFSPAIIVVGYSPAVAALVATGIFWGKKGLGRLLKQFLVWRVAFGWYAAALLGPLVLVFLAHVLAAIFSGEPSSEWLASPIGVDAAITIGPLIAGSLGEELGWRGFAQPNLQAFYRILTAAVIVGLIWATWHLWVVLAPGGSDNFALANIIQTYSRLVATAIVYAWLYNATGGSLLIVALAHTAHNASLDLMPISEGDTAVAWLIAALYVVIAGLVIWFWRRRILAPANSKHAATR